MMSVACELRLLVYTLLCCVVMHVCAPACLRVTERMRGGAVSLRLTEFFHTPAA